jgi:hypothetical protein
LAAVFTLGLLWSIGVDLRDDTPAQHVTGRPILGEGGVKPNWLEARFADP